MARYSHLVYKYEPELKADGQEGKYMYGEMDVSMLELQGQFLRAWRANKFAYGATSETEKKQQQQQAKALMRQGLQEMDEIMHEERRAGRGVREYIAVGIAADMLFLWCLTLSNSEDGDLGGVLLKRRFSTSSTSKGDAVGKRPSKC
eukprot:scaffold7226_cov387-Prasinococcus_capsulatus_cf.AAC.9